MTPLLVAFISIFIVICILAWDVYLYSDNTERNSISQVIIDSSKKSPMVPALIGFSMGLLLGHLFG